MFLGSLPKNIVEIISVIVIGALFFNFSDEINQNTEFYSTISFYVFSGYKIIPSIQTLLQLGHQISMGLPTEKGDDHFELESSAMQCGIPVHKIEKSQLDQNLSFWKSLNEKSGTVLQILSSKKWIVSTSDKN